MRKVKRDEFKHTCEMRMKSFGISTEALAAMFGKAKARVVEALGGDRTPRAQQLRVQIDLKLTGMCDEERACVVEEIEAVRDKYPELKGKLSVIIPEDMMYVVTEDGFPAGVWDPRTQRILPLEPTLMRVTGRKVEK